MIKRIARCPYCGAGEIALDYQDMEMVFNPDTIRQQPCEHLVCVQGMYCHGEVFPDGARRVGMAKLEWRHPDFRGVSSDVLLRQASQMNAATKGPGAAALQLPCRVEELALSECWQPSGEEMIRWYDQIGWEQAATEELPSQERSVQGWILFAHHSADMTPALAG